MRHPVVKLVGALECLMLSTVSSRLMQILLMRISLVQCFETFQKYLPCAFIGLFIS